MAKRADVERPVEVRPGHSRKHKTETRIFARNIHESFCVQKGCKFYGQHAVQGVCHTRETWAGSHNWDYLDEAVDAAAKATSEGIKLYRKHYRGRAYVERLEREMFQAWLDRIFHNDEMIRTRRENSLLRHEVAKLRAKLGNAGKVKP